MFNIVWCIDAFTPENGATLIAPGSHRLNGGPPSEEAVRRMIPVVAPAGSLLLLDGRLWHTNGVNTCGVSRARVFSVYTLPWLMPQENWSLSLNPSVRQFGFPPQVLDRVKGRDRI